MDQEQCFEKIRNAKRVVIKVGTRLLTDPSHQGGVDLDMIRKLRSEILYLKSRGIEPLLVSSGAVGMGRLILRNMKVDTDGFDGSIAFKQALSAIGQGRLISLYGELFGEKGIPVSQLLITARDFRDRRAYLNIGYTLETLIRLGVLPIVNENDTVSTEELRFGDNDLLSAACTSLFKADLLIILTGVDGFHAGGERVPFISEITQEHLSLAGGPTGPGSGGMITKMRAGQLCSMSGEMLAILPGAQESPIRSLFEGNNTGTLICTRRTGKLSARKRWLLYSRTRGSVIIDGGARQALMDSGSSLLPAGIKNLSGSFLAGDVIEIEDLDGVTMGRGIVKYSRRELQKTIGMKGDEIKRSGLLNRSEVVIHRNDMILENLPGLRKLADLDDQVFP